MYFKLKSNDIRVVFKFNVNRFNRKSCIKLAVGIRIVMFKMYHGKCVFKIRLKQLKKHNIFILF